MFIAIILPLFGCATVQRAADIVTGTAVLEQKKTADIALAKIKCQELCQNEIGAGRDLDAGPCLSDSLIPGWVCDVAHNPRAEADNLPQNQCAAFRSGQAGHFVEVDGNCNLIKAY